MKKLFILIISLFFLTGCYDYKEINNLAFVSAVGIDMEDDDFVVTLEILNDKLDKDSKNITTYAKTGKAPSLAKAIENASSQVVDLTNYTHIKLVILSKEVAENHLSSITDFFLRSTYFRENFYLISTIDNKPKDVLETTSKENPIASAAIIELLENNAYSSNSAVLKTFDSIIEEIIAYGKDTCFSNILLEDNDFKVDGIVVYSDYDYAGKLNNEEAMIYNVLNNDFYRPIISTKYDDKSFSVSLATGNPSASIKKNKIVVDGLITGKIMDNEANINIRNLDELTKINKDFTTILNDKISAFIKNIQDKKSDILGLGEKYYQKERKKNKMLWLYLNINSKIEFSINKKGLIYEVQDEK